MKHHDVSQQQMAKDLHMTQPAISHYFSKAMTIRGTFLLALKGVYSLSPQWLIEGRGPMLLINSNSYGGEVESFIDSFLELRKVSRQSIVELTRALSASEKGRANINWVYCSERMPEEKDRWYLISYYNTLLEAKPSVHVGFFSKKEYWGEGAEPEPGEVVYAWAEIPEPATPELPVVAAKDVLILQDFPGSATNQSENAESSQ